MLLNGYDFPVDLHQRPVGFGLLVVLDGCRTIHLRMAGKIKTWRLRLLPPQCSTIVSSLKRNRPNASNGPGTLLSPSYPEWKQYDLRPQASERLLCLRQASSLFPRQKTSFQPNRQQDWGHAVSTTGQIPIDCRHIFLAKWVRARSRRNDVGESRSMALGIRPRRGCLRSAEHDIGPET